MFLAKRQEALTFDLPQQQSTSPWAYNSIYFLHTSSCRGRCDASGTLSKGRAVALWPWGRPWPSPKGSGQGPANFIRVGPGLALALLVLNI